MNSRTVIARHSDQDVEKHGETGGIDAEMTTRSYIALIHKDSDSDYGVSFPDLPGCATAGRDLDEAHAFAEEALALHMTGMLEDDGPVPELSSLESIMDDPENQGSVAVLVPFRPHGSRVIRVNIRVPEDVLRQIDTHAERVGMNRFGFLVQAAKSEMGKR